MPKMAFNFFEIDPWVQNPMESTFEEINCGQVFTSLPLLKSRQQFN